MMYKPFNVEVTASECNNDLDTMIKKFNKRTKKALVIEAVMEKKFYKSKSKIKHEHIMRLKKIKEIEKKHPERKDKSE